MRFPVLVSSAVLVIAGCATGKSADPSIVEANATGVQGEAIARRSSRIIVEVKAVNLATRTITVLREAGGEPESFTVGPSVRRLAEIGPGDVITVEMEEGLLLEYQPVGTAAVPPKAVAAGAVAGADSVPAAAVAAGVQGTVTVVGIDAGTRVVTFQGADGNQYKVRAGPKVALDKLKVGDRLLATYVATVVLSAEKGGSKL
jgi:hypothetical protein